MTRAGDPDAIDTKQVAELLEGRYQLGELIGRGGMAEVHRGVDLRLDREVAIKLLAHSPGADRARFAAEARMLAQFNHPNLVRLFDAGDDGSVAWLVMELVKGTTLAERCHNGPLSDHDVTEAGRQLADALRYVHGEGVIHRDVKPSNILFDDQRCLLADFGVARLVDSASLTVTGTMLGTPAYLAPEQVAGEPVGPPADVYSLGLVLAEALSGRRVFVGTAVETAAARLSSFCKKVCAAGPSCTNTKPGLVQNCPTPRVKDPCRPAASSSGRCCKASGRKNTGLTLPISA